MTIRKITSIILLYAAATINAQETNAAQYGPGCGLLRGNIFCFGGAKGNITNNDGADSSMYMLDLSKNGTMADLSTRWTAIQPNTNGVNVETRFYSQFTAVSDTQIVFSGGFSGTSPIQDQTIVYDVATNSWSKYANYEESPYGNRQIYYGTSAFVPGKGAVFYGGFEQHVNANWTINTNQNLTATLFNGNDSRVVGYVDATYLNINETNVWNVPQPQNNVPSVFSAFQSSVYSPFDKRVYYLGGTYQDTTVADYKASSFANWHSLNYALYFDTTTNTWGNQSLGGSIIPTNRRFHSLNIIPNDQSKILLYGGESNSAVLSDICFTLDLNTFNWTQVNFPITIDGADLLRSRHSAIVLGNDTLFMAFGLTSTGQITSRPLLFNISSSSSISYMSQYVAPTIPSNSTSSVSPVDGTTTKSGGLSTGAIVGIAIGAAAAVVIAAVALFFYLRKKKASKKNTGEYEVARTGTASFNQSHENIEVNWDEIEKKYAEVPPVEPSTLYKPDDSVTNGTFSQTLTQSDGSVGHTIEHQVNVTHTIVETNSTPHTIIKPDGANH